VRLELTDGRASVTVRDVPPVRAVAVVVASTPHAPYPHKTGARACFDAARDEALRAGADDALLVSAAGLVAEGTLWSVFWWEGEGLRTPGLELGVLPGIGRGRVLELARGDEGRYRREDLAGRSVFLTNAVRGVVAVRTLNGEAVPADARTDALARRFWPV
jgi:branched-subunit amino acid aminotransferase/4-amino-4-deoxychorismate lyase